MKRFTLFYILPTLLLLGAAIAPLATGERTLYIRDVLTSHYPLKASHAEALREGDLLPLVDPHRAGGQPLLGNPNALPLYPDNLLYLVAPTLWALNAHFWLHWLLAPFAFFWLARAWGLSRPAAWAAGTLYTTSGFLLSLLNFYNLIAAATLAPAFLAAVLDGWIGDRRRMRVAAAGLWALLLLAGDPLFAALAFVLGLSAGWMRHRRPPTAPLGFAVAIGLGTLLTAPMWVEFLRILPLSYRGYQSFSPETIWLQSWDPRMLVEWLVPLFFGPPDFSFWGQRFSDGLPPLFYSLAPGLLALALVASRGRPRERADGWAWSLVLGGIFLALGKHNPLLTALEGLPGIGVLRFPVKAWPAVAIGLALLGGLGFERLARGDRRPLRRALLGLAALLLTAWSVFSFAPGRSALFDAQRLRWAGICLISLAFLALLGLALRLARSRPAVGGGLLLAVHVGAQLILLRPLYDADLAAPYVERPALADLVPADALVVHGGMNDLFGPGVAVPSRPGSEHFPDARTSWITRHHFAELYPFAGIPWGYRYAFNFSPEGLDSFFSIALGRAIKSLPDAARLRLLAASGVEILLLDRPLERSPEVDQLVRLVGTRESAGYRLHVYALRRPAEKIQVVGVVHRAAQMNEALRLLTRADFDPRTMTVLPGNEEDRIGEGGRVLKAREGREEIEVEVEAGSGGGVLVVQRAYLGIWRAAIDGTAVDTVPANLHRLGVEVPPGRHRVRLWVDRRPTRIAVGAALLGLVGLGWMGWGRRASIQRP